MNLRAYLLLLSAVLIVVYMLVYVPAIPQDNSYHNFSDQRTLLGIPNAINVLSNFPYLVFGLMGVFQLWKQVKLGLISLVKPEYLLFFVGVILVAIGSTYYHLEPTNERLLWDRLAMSITFMALFTIILAEYIHEQAIRWLLIPLLIVGVFSVVYWSYTESFQQGDLRGYILVQFIPMIFIPFILWLYRPRFIPSKYFWFMMGCYWLAKLFELLDQQIFDEFAYVSGHSLKHLISSLGVYVFYRALKNRTRQMP